MGKLLSIIFIFIYLFFSGCIDEPIPSHYSLELEDSAELLRLLESKGDYINSPDAPSLIEAVEVYNNLGKYRIIDIRDSVKFLDSHIETAVNIKNDRLFDYIININSNEKIVLVSETGQSAAYYTSLFRLYGITNIYSLNFGMSSWNIDFAGPWLEAAKIDTGSNFNLTDSETPKNNFTSLPGISYKNPTADIEGKLLERIQLLLSEGFTDTFSSEYKPATINFLSISSSHYIVCMGLEGLYVSKRYGITHPSGAVHFFYEPSNNSDFKSINFLQTLPLDRKIALYSYNGQRSAYMTAYLRVLGFDACSILFGGNNFMYDLLLSVPTIEEYCFKQSVINNFEYIKSGN